MITACDEKRDTGLADLGYPRYYVVWSWLIE